MRRVSTSGFLCGAAFLALVCLGESAQAGQKLVGQSCSGDNNALDWDANAQCNGTVFIKGPLMLGAAAVPPYASTSCDSAKAGVLQWTGTSFQACNGGSWSALGTCASAGFGSGSTLYTSSGTWTPPTGVSSTNPLTVRVLVVGGGGGAVVTAGGAGSGYVRAAQLYLTSADSVTVTVGAGGAAGSNGGSSSFGNYLTARGGYAAGNGGSGGGGLTINQSTSGSGGAGGSNGANGVAGTEGKGWGQQASIVTSTTTVLGVVFQSATFAAGAGGAAATTYSGPSSSGYYWHPGGGGGGILISGRGPDAEMARWNGRGGFGYGAGGGSGTAVGGGGAPGVVYVEY